MNTEKLKELIGAYKAHFNEYIGRELYKWQAVKWFQDNWDIEAEDFALMLSKSFEKTFNLLTSANHYPRDMVIKYAKLYPEDVRSAFRILFDERSGLRNRIETFKNKIEKLHRLNLEDKNHYQDANAISTYLWLCYPNKYYIYKYSEANEIFLELGIDFKLRGQFADAIIKCYEVYDIVADRLKQDKDFRVLLNDVIKEDCYKDDALKIMATDFAFFVGVYMKKYWLGGYSFGSTNSQLERFLSEGIWEGRFDEKNDKKQISLVSKISEGDIMILKSSFTKGKNHDISCLRVKAVGIVTTNVVKVNKGEYIECKCNVDYVSLDEMDFEGCGSYRQTIHKVESKHTEIIDYVNSVLKNKSMLEKNIEQKYSEYVKLLKGAYNLVLTGAPGTGKTYMAREIAKEMGAEVEFVQFHPSYDYTDFVEGLRPIEKNDGQMGFERKDGVFKEFCKRAINNLEIKISNKDISFNDIYSGIVSDIKEGKIQFYQNLQGENLLLKINEKGRIEYRENSPRTESEDNIELMYNYLRKNNIFDLSSYSRDDYWNLIGKLTQNKTNTVDYVEYHWILQELLNRTLELEKSCSDIKDDIIDSKKKFVFIIDEINRGEASKIFGELFYAIDPGYRGNKKDNRVKTQYQNLIPESDVFAAGFYVPENVYILATMNDIDRSVESMDFAMRRRFTWKEIKPNDTVAMLDDLDCKDEAKMRMERLNEAIAKVDGLGRAYMIGPAYFLKLKDNNGDFDALWDMNLNPLLNEYLRGFRKADNILEDLKNIYDGVNVDDDNEN